MNQQILPGMERFFPDVIQIEKRKALSNMLDAFIHTKTIIKQYPSLIKRAGTLGKSVELLLNAVETLLSIEMDFD